MSRNLRIEPVEFFPRRKTAVDEEIGYIEEGGMLGQILDRIPPVAKDSLFAIDEGNLAVTRSRVGKSGIHGDGARLTSQFPDVETDFLFGTDGDGKFDFLIVDRETCVVHGCGLFWAAFRRAA